MTGLPRLPEPPFRRAVLTTPADRAGARVDCFPAHAAFPKWPEGRHPHCHFRGLLKLHSRYGPSDRSVALRRPLSRGSSPAGCPAEPLVSYRINRQFSGWKSSSTDNSRLRGAQPLADIARTVVNVRLQPHLSPYRRRPVQQSGSLAKFAAMCRASSRVGRFDRPAMRRRDISEIGRSGSARLALETTLMKPLKRLVTRAGGELISR